MKLHVVLVLLFSILSLGVTLGAWAITTPTSMENFANNTATVSGSGDADNDSNASFTVEIFRTEGSPIQLRTTMGSASGTSTSGSNPTWNASIEAPLTGEWQNGTAWFQVTPAGYTGTDIKVRIEFVDP